MEATENLNLPYLMPSQAQKHVTHNEALRALDALIHIAVVSRTVEAPPPTPERGDRYIVPDGTTDAWAGHDQLIAAWQDGAWMFHTPRSGWLVYIRDDNALVYWNGAGWADHATTISELQDMALLGVNATADATNRLALSAAASLFTHEGAGHRLKINKASAGDTASVLFQTDWSGRAEFGLAGDDDFHVKVSADGVAFTEAMVVDAASGKISFPAGIDGIGGMREQLAANRTYHVATTGSDVDDGLTPEAAFATVQKAVDEAHRLDCSIFDVTIQLAPGSYAGATIARPLFGGGTLSIIGNELTPGEVMLTTGIAAENGSRLLVSGVKFDIAADWNHALLAGLGAHLRIGAVEFGAVGGNADHIHAESPCRITIEQDYLISGGGRRHVGVSGAAILFGSNRTITLTGTPSFVDFVLAGEAASISHWNLTVSGAATGNRFAVSTNGIINLFGKPADFLPGDAAGTSTLGGIYA
jgi:hypothetical protein